MLHTTCHSQRPFRALQYLSVKPRYNIVALAIAPDVLVEPTVRADEPLSFEPEELVLQPGELSPINRKPSDEAFQCLGCVDSACQVRARCLGQKDGCFRRRCCGTPTFSRTQETMQGPSGCNKTSWRFDESGYLRAVLTARVYDVAVRCCGC
jgi:hypothetical protein